MATEQRDEDDSPVEWLKEVNVLPGDRDRAGDSDNTARVAQLVDWLDTSPDGAKRPRDAEAAGLLRAAYQIGAAEHPNEAGLALIRERAPKFVMFENEFRDLPTASFRRDKAPRLTHLRWTCLGDDLWAQLEPPRGWPPRWLESDDIVRNTGQPRSGRKRRSPIGAVMSSVAVEPSGSCLPTKPDTRAPGTPPARGCRWGSVMLVPEQLQHDRLLNPGTRLHGGFERPH